MLSPLLSAESVRLAEAPAVRVTARTSISGTETSSIAAINR